MAGETKQIYSYMNKKINSILFMKPDGAQKATLANLRHGIGKEPGDMPQLWGEFLLELPETFMSENQSPSKAEYAIYHALTLFALHQQGKNPDTAPMSSDTYRLGEAIGQLVLRGTSSIQEDRDRILKRFNPMATADTLDEVVHYMRGIIQMLRAENIPVNYPQLASDLYRYQYESMQAQVRLEWGEQFYRTINKKEIIDHE